MLPKHEIMFYDGYFLIFQQEYEKYITSVYPHWKENVEISRMTKLKSPDEVVHNHKLFNVYCILCLNCFLTSLISFS